jgi:hypothetical protein
MLAKVINLKAKRGFSVKAAANYIAGDRAQQDAPELYSSDPTAVADYIGREGVSEGGSFNLEGLDPSSRRWITSRVLAGTERVSRAILSITSSCPGAKASILTRSRRVTP